MALILCIETGTDICSVGLASNGEIIALREESGRNHAGKLAVFADELLKESGFAPQQLDAVAFAMGPGSYTGLRIGSSFAKGLCYALGIPLIAIDSLLSMAVIVRQKYEQGILKAANWNTAFLCPMIDARRMEVYTSVFDTSLNRLSDVSAEIVTEHSFKEFLNSGKEFFIFGNGAEKCCAVLPQGSVKFVEASPSAAGLARMAEEKLSAGEIVDTAYFEPAYLKDFVVTESKKKLF